MLRLAVTVSLVLAGSASAQTIADQSGSGIPPDMLSAATKAFALIALDPAAVQLRNLHVFRPVGADYDALCGEFNGKNAFGGYVGYRPFQYLPPHDTLTFSQC